MAAGESGGWFWEAIMRHILVSGLLALALMASGCASSIMRGYVGKPLQEAMLDYGPPSNAFDMPDGSRAFQWVMNSTYVTPTTVTSTTTPIGNTWYTNTQIVGGQAISGQCVYTMLARWDAGQNAWLFYDFRPPNMMCE
jgi:hypothetical protein